MQWLQDPNQRDTTNLNNVRREVVDISGRKRKSILNLRLVNLKRTVRSNVSETCIGASLILSRVTSLELL